MTAQPRRQHDELRASLSALMDCCPVDQCNPVDCPLFALRKMERREREQWFEALNEADLKYLAAYHYVCQNLRIHPHASRTEPAPPERQPSAH
jgi:hypothetical protein